MGKYYDWFGMLTKSFASRALDSEFVGVRSREETKTAKVREQDTIRSLNGLSWQMIKSSIINTVFRDYILNKSL